VNWSATSAFALSADCSTTPAAGRRRPWAESVIDECRKSVTIGPEGARRRQRVCAPAERRTASARDSRQRRPSIPGEKGSSATTDWRSILHFCGWSHAGTWSAPPVASTHTSRSGPLDRATRGSRCRSRDARREAKAVRTSAALRAAPVVAPSACAGILVGRDASEPVTDCVSRVIRCVYDRGQHQRSA
jgi:hypothetical protein